MTQAAAFQSRFVKVIPVVSRSVIQIITEVPIEHEAEVLAVTGGMMSHPGKDVWLAQARLQPNLVDAGEKVCSPPSREAGGAQPRKVPAAAPASRLTIRARKLCGVSEFLKFLNANGHPVATYEEASSTVKWICHVGSKDEFIPGTRAGNAWEELYAKFNGWQSDNDGN